MTFICYLLQITLSTTAFVYLCVVLLISLAGCFVPAALVSIMGFLCLCYFFVPPIFSFRVNKLQDMVALVAFLATALIVTRLVSNTRRQLEERKAAEALLRQQAELLEVTHDAIFVRDPNDVITFWNRGAEEQYGWTREQAVGKVSYQLMQTIFPAPLEEITADLLRTGRWEGKLIHTRQDGTQITVASRWSLQRDEQGRPAGTLETNNDITERERAEEEIQALTERLLSAQEEERARIARELHDDLNQEIAALALSVSRFRSAVKDRAPQAGEQLESVLERIARLSAAMRELSHQLHPATLEYSDLATALAAHCAEFSATTGMSVSLQSSGSFDDIPKPVLLCVYRVTQEALQNVAKHAAVTEAAVHLERAEDRVRLTVSDRRVGFRPSRARVSGGLGLVSMKERVRFVHGTLSVESEPKQGTTLRIEIPLISKTVASA